MECLVMTSLPGDVFGNKSVVDQLVAPFSGHNQDCVLMQFGSNQWIHLCHVAAQPARNKKIKGQNLEYSLLIRKIPIGCQKLHKSANFG